MASTTWLVRVGAGIEPASPASESIHGFIPVSSMSKHPESQVKVEKIESLPADPKGHHLTSKGSDSPLVTT